MLLHYTALITLLTVLLQAWTMIAVGGARGRYGVKAPATTGNPDFERVLRVQANTVESTLMFLPALWLCAIYLGDCWAAGLGALWLLGRLWYALSYSRSAEARGKGFLVGFIAIVGLVLGGGYGLLRTLLA